MVPSASDDPALLSEHAFYATGNLKYAMKAMKFQSYDLVLKKYNHAYSHAPPPSFVSSYQGTILSLSALILVFAIYWISKYISSWKQISRSSQEKEDDMV